jgi:hypothetical protein
MCKPDMGGYIEQHTCSPTLNSNPPMSYTLSGKGRYVKIEGEGMNEKGESHAHHVSKSDPGE